MGNPQERRERILRLLMLREKWTMRELAQELGVAERTVIRDIGALSLSKPICVDTGRRGGVYLIERKSLSRPTLTAREGRRSLRFCPICSALPTGVAKVPGLCLDPPQGCAVSVGNCVSASHGFPQ